ncbi:hypothetical protein [Capybara microvirus Cap3_SP_333]|nr:hypothetical protein [Capybara microvirus Cap3_SP_333]
MIIFYVFLHIKIFNAMLFYKLFIEFSSQTDSFNEEYDFSSFEDAVAYLSDIASHFLITNVKIDSYYED